MNPLEEKVAAEIRRRGPIPFAEVVEAALYDPAHGFYATGGTAGRRGDFLTSPEVGPLFGSVLARALDTWWDELGRPDPYLVVDAGAGPGTLARAVLAASPGCAPALRYVLVERSAALRDRHREHLPLAHVAHAFVPATHGPIVVSLAELPRVDGPVVVLANELLDNLPFGLAEWRAESGWREVRVALTDEEDRLVAVTIPLGSDEARLLDRLVPEPPAGCRVPIQRVAAQWLRDALDLTTEGGHVVVIDYASTTADLARRPWTEWVRTYRAHERGGHPLQDLGRQDITCQVAIDRLAALRQPTSERSQSEFLAAFGLDELVAEGRRIWAERAHIGDLAAVRARSRVGEAAALTDPAGLGTFRVLEWAR
ncbi:MAG: SAM-dependent methyltransferase [Acidimicrobiales bacterium]